tara:strand:- start:168 stop:344 length:177 start_codon:yes stop_codon:yes gene_type:complete
MTAIQTVCDLQLNQSIPQLRHILCQDEQPLAAEALKALIEIDEEFLGSLIECVREKKA